jgi:hypothetical protein
MKVPRNIFREYDVRGLIDTELTPELARALGRAFASTAWARLDRAPVLAVGRDNRPSGTVFAQAVRQGIMEAGGIAIDVGMMPTPALYFSVEALATERGADLASLSAAFPPPQQPAGAEAHGEIFAPDQRPPMLTSAPAGRPATTRRPSGMPSSTGPMLTGWPATTVSGLSKRRNSGCTIASV